VTLDEFYQQLCRAMQAGQAACAITGGLACVEFGIVEHTEDCDLLCDPGVADRLLALLAESEFAGQRCQYRSTLSPPLDACWLLGGWTCHFQWPGPALEEPFLDVFGVPPRMSSPWQTEVHGCFAGRQTVAEMKRTRRRKDWDQATALGLQMLRGGDERGWLHIFSEETLTELTASLDCSPELRRQRPLLDLAFSRSALLGRALAMEVEYWSHLDRFRLKAYETAVGAYSAALRARPASADLLSEHRRRLELARRYLPERPLREYGIDRLLAEAKAATAVGLDPDLLRWLPDAKLCLARVVAEP